MDLKQLEYIIAIAEEHSISKAAQRFFLSPSALSQYLKRLEESEHLPPLFYRKNRDLYLTDAGRIYVNGALTILNLSKKLENSSSQNRSFLRIAIPADLEYSFITECLPCFAPALPHMLLEIQVAEAHSARKMLLEGKLEAAILLEQNEGFPSLLTARPLHTDHIILAASPAEDIDCSMLATDPDDLSFIMPPEGTFWFHICQKICMEENLQPTVFCRNNNFQAIANLLQRRPENKSLAAFLPGRIFQQWTDQKSGLREISLNRPYLFHLYFVTLSGKSIHRPALEELYQILVSCL